MTLPFVLGASTRKGAERVTGVATYSRFRRFSVSTDEAVKKPPPE